MNFGDVPIEMLYEQMVFPKLQGMVGQRFKLAHLKSERGKQLNGKVCKVIGYDRNQDARLHCQLVEEEPKKTIKAKFVNLIPAAEANQVLENLMNASSRLSDKKIKQFLRRALQAHQSNTDRQDLRHRLELYKTLLEKIQNGTAKEENGDYCFPCGAGIDRLDGGYGRIMQLLKPACYGNEVCDLRYMDIGLKGDNETECAICQEVLADDTNVVVVTLPCLHNFHESCIRQWLGSDLGTQNWNCPSCRKPVPGDMTEFCTKYDKQLQRRMDEFPLSGFCAKCMIMIFETQVFG